MTVSLLILLLGLYALYQFQKRKRKTRSSSTEASGFSREQLEFSRSLSPDISDKIAVDFKTNNRQALSLLYYALQKEDYLHHERVIRCIVFLAEGDLKKLEHVLALAQQDKRDVMFWAEYEDRDAEDGKSRRVRDFNKAFGQNDLDQDV